MPLRDFFVSAMQATTVRSFIFMLIGGDLLGIPTLIALHWTPFFFVPALYVGWMYYDRKTPHEAGRQIQAVRRWGFWRHMADFFPIRLHKTVELDPAKNYMLCFHPHGVLCISAFVNFATEATGFSTFFPGLTIHLLTLDVFFHIMPIFRDCAMAVGLASSSKESISYKLTKLGPGQAVAIVAGGVAEANLTDVNNPYCVKVNGRRGFIREALKAGAAVVPVFSFGETEILQQIKAEPGSLLKRYQMWSHKVFRFAPMKFSGEGGSLLPFRKPINTVVGSPLQLPEILNPSDSDIDYWHAKYVDALKQLFNDNKEKFASPNKELEIF